MARHPPGPGLGEQAPSVKISTTPSATPSPRFRTSQRPAMVAAGAGTSWFLVEAALPALGGTGAEGSPAALDLGREILDGVRVGVAHHLGWAVAVTASTGHEVVDR